MEQPTVKELGIALIAKNQRLLKKKILTEYGYKPKASEKGSDKKRGAKRD